MWDRVTDIDELMLDEIDREEEDESMEEERKGGEEDGEQGDTPQKMSIKRDETNRQVPVRRYE